MQTPRISNTYRFFHRSNNCTNAPRCYVTRLPDNYHAQGKTRQQNREFRSSNRIVGQKTRKGKYHTSQFTCGCCTVPENRASGV